MTESYADREKNDSGRKTTEPPLDVSAKIEKLVI